MKTQYIYHVMIFFIININASTVYAQNLKILQKITNLDKTLQNINTLQATDSNKDIEEEIHYCNRKCDGIPKNCTYTFEVEWYQSMSKACYDCPFNSADCDRKDCVVANGVSRSITVVNRMMPGPTIEVCQYDTIFVHVKNHLMAAGTTIHWHGMHQKETPYMDGVPFVTQCPIQPESTFTYEFKAAEAGTYFWHSHIGLQRGDGVTGALIIRKPRVEDVHNELYDFDRSEHIIQVFDWNNKPSRNIFTEHYHADGDMTPTMLLINGRGRFNVTEGNRTAMTQAPIFKVTENFRYRFRFINAEFAYCPVELSIDDHNITLIASDGYDLEPVTVKSLVSYAGERFDFIINANQKVDNYWIRIRGLLNCVNKTEVRQVAVLHYEGASNAEPAGELKWESRIRDKLAVNTENEGEEQNETTPISKLKSHHLSVPDDDTLKNTADETFYVAYDLNIKDNLFFNKPPYYGHQQVISKNKLYSVPTPQLNHISMKLPKSPFLVSRLSNDSFCNNNTVSESCKTSFCQCHHVISVKLNSVVEVVIVDEGKHFDANHPFHLHGHSFRVIGIERLGTTVIQNSTEVKLNRISVEDVQKLDEEGKLHRNLKNAPVKDTVTVPDGGYTIIRFKANNPGYWLFHCHIEFHAEVGMALVFKVGEHEDMKNVPQGFPKCGDFSNNGQEK